MQPEAVSAMRRRTSSLQATADSPQNGDGPMLTRCAWCDRIALGEQWLRREDFRDRQPQQGFRLTHGICPDCVASVKAERSQRPRSR